MLACLASSYTTCTYKFIVPTSQTLENRPFGNNAWIYNSKRNTFTYTHVEDNDDKTTRVTTRYPNTEIIERTYVITVMSLNY